MCLPILALGTFDVWTVKYRLYHMILAWHRIIQVYWYRDFWSFHSSVIDDSGHLRCHTSWKNVFPNILWYFKPFFIHLCQIKEIKSTVYKYVFFMVIYECYGRGSQIFQKCRGHLKVLGGRRVTEDPQNILCPQTIFSFPPPNSLSYIKMWTKHDILICIEHKTMTQVQVDSLQLPNVT